MTRSEAMTAFSALDTPALYAEMQRRGIASPDFDAADRVQIVFRRFPPVEARQIVKDAGFYWSPSLKCWQRRITRKAERAAYDVSCKLAALHLH